MDFVGRTNELSTLEKEYQRKNGFVVIYGRRRVGKTTLIKQFLKDKNALYFLPSQENELQNLRKLTKLIADFTEQPFLANSKFDDWQSVFSVFAAYKPKEKKVLVIDEFPYLVAANSAFPSIFQSVWDEIFTNKNVMVILCGSYTSMMVSDVLSHSSPLYGRRTSQIRLRPLDFTEFCEAFPNKTFSEQCELYAVTGGIPKYIEFFDNGLTLWENISDTVLNRSGFLYEEPIFLLESEIRETVNYFSIMRAISLGNHKLSEIAGFLEQKTSSITPYLTTLSDLFLIEKRLPVTEKNAEKSRKGLYFISDYFFDFWFKFVYPYRGELEMGNTEYVLNKIKNAFVVNHVSYVFEDISKTTFLKCCLNGELHFTPSKIGSYWSGNTEINVVLIDNEHKYIFAGECKYYQKHVPADVYFDLVKKCENIPDFNGYDLKFGVFSKSGFDKRLIELKENNPDLYLFNNGSII